MRQAHTAAPTATDPAADSAVGSHRAGSTAAAHAPTQAAHLTTPDLPPQRRSERLLSLVAGVCTGIIVVATTVLMMPTPAMAADNPAAHPTDGDEVHALRLQRFALNALMVPLIDDTVPARWTKNIAAMHCGKASRVLVDGKPLRPGAHVPARPFTISWSMVDCRPLSRQETFNGNVRMTVYPENEGYSAMVVPTALKVSTYDSTAVWSKPFSVALRNAD